MKNISLNGVLFALSLSCFACGGSPEELAQTSDQLGVSRPTNTQPTKETLQSYLAETYFFTTDVVQQWMDVVDVSVPIEEQLPLDVSEGDQRCTVNRSEVGLTGIRVEGELEICDTIELNENIEVSFIDGGDSEPYKVRLEIDIGDIEFRSKGELDISAVCVGLDQEITGVIKDLVLKVTLKAPTSDRDSFKYHAIDIDFGDVELDSISAPNISIRNLVTEFFDKKLDTDRSLRTELEKSIEDGLSKESMFEDIASYVQFAFALDSRFNSSTDTIYSVKYDDYSSCDDEYCARYRIYYP